MGMKDHRFFGHENAFIKPIDKRYWTLTPCELYDALEHLWIADTCAPRMRAKRNEENKTLGQCSITAFLVQDIYGGEVKGVKLPDGNFHCFNIVGDCLFDLTSEQFGDQKLDYEHATPQDRDSHFAKLEKKERYLLLKKRLEEYLGIA